METVAKARKLFEQAIWTIRKIQKTYHIRLENYFGSPDPRKLIFRISQNRKGTITLLINLKNEIRNKMKNDIYILHTYI